MENLREIGYGMQFSVASFFVAHIVITKIEII